MKDVNAFQAFRELLRRDRSIRRFDHSMPIPEKTLRQLVELTRYCASGRNAQPLRYRLVCSEEECAAIFPALAWAGYYRDWMGPEPEQRPVAYLVQCLDTKYGENCLCDDGLQLQAITLGAQTLGIGGCIIKAFNADMVAEALGIDTRYKPRYVLALGYPDEAVEIVEMTDPDKFEYYRDAADRQCVPKRSLDELIS